MAFQTPVVSSARSVGEGDCLQDDHGVTGGNIHKDQDDGGRCLSPPQDAGILWRHKVCVCEHPVCISSIKVICIYCITKGIYQFNNSQTNQRIRS